MDRPLNILLVEDTPSDIRLTQEALKDTDLKYNLDVVTDGEQALDYLIPGGKPGKIPDLILLDLNMPKKSGHDVLIELKEIPEFNEIPVILLTVSRDEQDILRALHLKMNYYINKPVSSEKLSILIKAIQELQFDKEAGGHHSGDDAHVRYVMAGNPHTNPDILSRLAQEKNARIRARVAENPHTPQVTLLALARDPDSEVRLAVSENPSTPVAVLEDLAQDPDDDVRLGLSSNPNVPAHILEKLTGDNNMYVMEAAKKTLSARV